MDHQSTNIRRIKDDSLGSRRVYKKSSPNSILTLYLGSRDLISRRGVIEPLRGVIYIDPKFMGNQKIYGQLTLTFRYGREDEEVMGLKFCNEAVISLKQIWPRVNYDTDDVTPLQQALLDRLGQGAYPFSLEVGTLAPPSVQLIPAKKYYGAPIGTSYDARVFMSDVTDERFQRRTTVKLGIRLLYKIPSDLKCTQQVNPTYKSLPKSIRLRLSPKKIKFHQRKNHNHSHSQQPQQNSSSKSSPALGTSTDYTISNSTVINVETHPLSLGANSAVNNMSTSSISANVSSITESEVDSITTTKSTESITNKGPEGCVDKPFLWTEGRVSLKASLNKCAYSHGEKVFVIVDIKNNSKKIIRKVRVFAVQYVDVCMFSNGKFKNVVADINENHQIKPGENHNYTYELLPEKGPTKNWIAVEGAFNNFNSPIISGQCSHLKCKEERYGGKQNLGCDIENDSITPLATPVSAHLEPSNPEICNVNYRIASSAHRGTNALEERNVFAIYVSYYVKIKLTLSGMGGEVSLKLPFILGYIDTEDVDDEKHNLANTEHDRVSLDINKDDKNTIHNSKSIDNYENDPNLKSGKTTTTMVTTPTLASIQPQRGQDQQQSPSRRGSHMSKENIIEEEIIQEDNLSLSTDDNSSSRKEADAKKYTHDKEILHRYKLKRSSYSRSCEDIESFTRDDGANVNSVKAVVHRQGSECNE